MRELDATLADMSLMNYRLLCAMFTGLTLGECLTRMYIAIVLNDDVDINWPKEMTGKQILNFNEIFKSSRGSL